MSKKNSKHKKANMGHSVQAEAAKTVNYKLWLGISTGLLLLVIAAYGLIKPKAVNAEVVTVYKSPTCGCCKKWVTHLEDQGFRVDARNTNDMGSIKRKNGVASDLQSCHTALVNGYVIEGHVPAADIKRLLSEKPDINGLSIPGMPMGSPGMEGSRNDPYEVLSIYTRGQVSVYNEY
jgi:hypothetical protein